MDQLEVIPGCVLSGLAVLPTYVNGYAPILDSDATLCDHRSFVGFCICARRALCDKLFQLFIQTELRALGIDAYLITACLAVAHNCHCRLLLPLGTQMPAAGMASGRLLTNPLKTLSCVKKHYKALTICDHLHLHLWWHAHFMWEGSQAHYAYLAGCLR